MRNLVLLGACLLSACATVVDPGVDEANETYIPFISTTGVLEWEARGEGAVYIRSATNQWYLVQTMNSCSRLHTANALGFVTSGLDQLDRNGAILAEGQRCPIRSVTLSGPPPEKTRG
jgi:hypothetical protein